MGGKHASTAEITTKLQTQKRLQEFDRFNQDFVNTYMQKRYQDKLPERNKQAQQATTVEDYITVENVDDFSKPERLSKRLARMGVASRR